MTENQFYWAVDCKTAGCGVLLLEHIAPYDPNEWPVLLDDVNDFDLTCPDCRRQNTYNASDVRWTIAPLQQQFVPRAAFRTAVKKDHR